jgi:hypothetical protein
MDRRQEDPLEDNASYVPPVSLQQSVGGQLDSRLKRDRDKLMHYLPMDWDNRDKGECSHQHHQWLHQYHL